MDHAQTSDEVRRPFDRLWYRAGATAHSVVSRPARLVRHIGTVAYRRVSGRGTRWTYALTDGRPARRPPFRAIAGSVALDPVCSLIRGKLQITAPGKEITMLRWAVIFFVIAIVAAVFGFGGIAAGATDIAKILFFVFLVVFGVTLIMGLMRR